MNVREVLSANIQALADAGFGNENSFAARSGAAKTTVRRMRLNESAAQIDKVEQVASLFKIRACDLLDPDLARRAKAGEPLRMGEPRPPVMAEAQWRALSPRARAFVEDLCSQASTGTLTDADITWLHDSLNRASASHAARRPAAETTAFAGKPPPAPEPGVSPKKTGDFFYP